MRKVSLAALVIVSLIGLPGNADTEFQDSIPIEVAEALFNTAANYEFGIYSDITDDFPAFDLPDNFSVMGSVVQYNNVRAVLGTDLELEPAMQSLVTALEQTGWQEFPGIRSPFPEGGFVAPTPAVVPIGKSLCHDDLGRLSMSAVGLESGNYFSLNNGPGFGNPQGSCASQIARQEQQMVQMNFNQGVRQYMPRMEVPASDNIRQRGPFIGGGSSSSGNAAETDSNLNSELDISELFAHFADQISEQGWELDSEIVGSRSATGNWTKSPEPDLGLVGTLSVLETSEGNYELRFRLIAEGGQSGGVFRR